MATQSKNPSVQLNSKIHRLLQAALSNQKTLSLSSGAANAVGKAYELKVLSYVANLLATAGWQLSMGGPKLNTNGLLKLPMKPCSAKGQKFNFLIAKEPISGDRYELWTSLQFRTLSYQREGSKSQPKALATRHEMDVALYKANVQLADYPDFDTLVFGATCKCTGFKKEYLRELLGLRRETASSNQQHASLAPWYSPPHIQSRYQKNVKAEPPSPLVLFSSDARVSNYQHPIDEFGAFVHYFP